jgi:hypothetical protein
VNVAEKQVLPDSLEQTVPLRRMSVKPELAAAELWLEIEALARFWRRRAFYCFVPAECPNGETDYSIDLEHLAFALGKIRYYQDLLNRRDRTLEVTTTERRRDRSEDSTETERRDRG